MYASASGLLYPFRARSWSYRPESVDWSVRSGFCLFLFCVSPGTDRTNHRSLLSLLLHCLEHVFRDKRFQQGITVHTIELKGASDPGNRMSFLMESLNQFSGAYFRPQFVFFRRTRSAFLFHRAVSWLLSILFRVAAHDGKDPTLTQTDPLEEMPLSICIEGLGDPVIPANLRNVGSGSHSFQNNGHLFFSRPLSPRNKKNPFQPFFNYNSEFVWGLMGAV